MLIHGNPITESCLSFLCATSIVFVNSCHMDLNTTSSLSPSKGTQFILNFCLAYIVDKFCSFLLTTDFKRCWFCDKPYRLPTTPKGSCRKTFCASLPSWLFHPFPFFPPREPLPLGCFAARITSFKVLMSSWLRNVDAIMLFHVHDTHVQKCCRLRHCFLTNSFFCIPLFCIFWPFHIRPASFRTNLWFPESVICERKNATSGFFRWSPLSKQSSNFDALLLCSWLRSTSYAASSYATSAENDIFWRMRSWELRWLRWFEKKDIKISRKERFPDVSR